MLESLAAGRFRLFGPHGDVVVIVSLRRLPAFALPSTTFGHTPHPRNSSDVAIRNAFSQAD